ncbi:N-acetyltransferase family protein [Paenibacillus solani]|uniref:GNAT family N-acetyltransferase n=1 Tax=Paenibacillus solani TaxID=1705565 RepID=UPI003D2A3200
MSDAITIHELDLIEPIMLEKLSDLLINVVDDGASVGFLSPLSKEKATQYWKDALQPGVTLWIAQCNGLVVGTVQLQLAMKPNASHRAEVAKLMVHPGYRRKGIAYLLMKHLENKALAKGISLLVLDTRAGDSSNKLYKSMDYKEVGRIPRYSKSSTGDLDDTVIYYKEI